jgi:predicted nucleotidyltransferase
MQIDLEPQDLETVREILSQYLPGVEVRAYGSRVTGKTHRGSDLDLAIMTSEPLSLDTRADLRDAFSESTVPFRVDLLDWAETTESFRAIVLRNSVVLQDSPVRTHV